MEMGQQEQQAAASDAEAKGAMSLIRSLFNCVNRTDDQQTDSGVNHASYNSTIINNISNQQQAIQVEPVIFGANLHSSDPNNIRCLPEPLRQLLVRLARDFASVPDLFRRPGNPGDVKRIIHCMTRGVCVDLEGDCCGVSHFTLANVAKKFLLALPDGLFGSDGEAVLLSVDDLTDAEDQITTVRQVLDALPLASWQLVALCFGLWHRMATQSLVPQPAALEAVAKSVAGSVFHTCAHHPLKVEQASRVMTLLIDGFDDSQQLFSQEMRQYFTDQVDGPSIVDVHADVGGSDAPMASQLARRRSLTQLEPAAASSTASLLSVRSTQSEFLSALACAVDCDEAALPQSAQEQQAADCGAQNQKASRMTISGWSDLVEQAHQFQRGSGGSRASQVMRKRQLERLARRSRWFSNQTAAQTPAVGANGN
uniref:Rho-GAP domain-containing protein n=1 Tax=Macrostomum lignano TaxID=282301 RepID=A0A1I8GL82_9PLAT